MTTFESVSAGISATIAAQAQAQDDGRSEDMAACYTTDAVVVVPGVATLEGREALVAAFDQWKPTAPQRHIVTNTVITEWSDDAAKATSDVVFVQKGDAGWSVQIVARYHDTFRLTGDAWLLSRREDEWVGLDGPITGD